MEVAMSGKGVNLFFENGNYHSLMRVTATGWQGVMYVAPREGIKELAKLKELKQFGVYLLLSESQIYVGEASDLMNRIMQHDKSKPWWTNVVLITKTDDSLTQTGINFLETSLIAIAKEEKSLKCENKNLGNKVKIDDMQKADLQPFLEEAIDIINLLNLTKLKTRRDDISSRLKFGTKQRMPAITYLKDNGWQFNDGALFSYATRGLDKDECWLNPPKECLAKDWYIILNNTKVRTLVVLYIPHGTFKVKEMNTTGFVIRKDTGALDMHINLSTLIERLSGINLTSYKYCNEKY